MAAARAALAWTLALAAPAWVPAVSQVAGPPAGAPAPRAATAGTPAGSASAANPAASATSAAAAPGGARPAPAAAYNSPAYDIEIIIFRARVTLGLPENWSAETAAAATVSGGEQASDSGRVGQLLAILPATEYRLTPLERKLRSSGAYTPVAHAAWVQTASAWGARAGLSLQTLGIDVPGLTGVVLFERGQFLHLGMTLDYTLQHPPPGLGAAPGTTFVMNETRRVDLYRRNYFDHPAFGVIALVTPARGPRPPGR